MRWPLLPWGRAIQTWPSERFYMLSSLAGCSVAASQFVLDMTGLSSWGTSAFAWMPAGKVDTLWEQKLQCAFTILFWWPYSTQELRDECGWLAIEIGKQNQEWRASSLGYGRRISFKTGKPRQLHTNRWNGEVSKEKAVCCVMGQRLPRELLALWVQDQGYDFQQSLHPFPAPGYVQGVAGLSAARIASHLNLCVGMW